MGYEYSQTMIFILDEFDTFERVARIKNKDYNTEIEFVDSKKATEFYNICESWGILIPNLRIKDTVLIYGASPSSSDAYQYHQYMSLILSYLNNDFKLKEPKC